MLEEERKNNREAFLFFFLWAVNFQGSIFSAKKEICGKNGGLQVKQAPASIKHKPIYFFFFFWEICFGPIDL